MSKKPLEVPFIDNEDGSRSFLSYPGWKCDFLHSPVPFKADMRIADMHRGRSAAQLELQDLETGSTFPMFLKGVMDMLKVCDMKAGAVSGWWYFVKRGANYGIEYSKEEPKVKDGYVQLPLPM